MKPWFFPIGIGGTPNSPYLRRWMLFPRGRWPNIYLHHTLHDDDDRALHDHPYWNVSVILRGGYVECYYDEAPLHGASSPIMKSKFRRPGDVIMRRATDPHRLSLPDKSKGAWSLFITGRRRREFGYWCVDTGTARWVHNRIFNLPTSYYAGVGKGCDP
jgi:hypothetical protein